MSRVVQLGFVLSLFVADGCRAPDSECEPAAERAIPGGDVRIAGDSGRSGRDGGGRARAGLSAIDLLVFTRTQGFRHDSIEVGVDAVSRMGEARGWRVEQTEDGGRFADDLLAPFDVVVWLNTSGDVLDGAQQEAFERWVRGGGGYVGVHAAADTEYDWEWYGSLVVARFDDHPDVQEATLAVEDRSHPATDHLGESWNHRDEWYNYESNPRGEVDVVMSVDESTYEGGAMGADHPIAWHRDVSEGRAFYTGLGHTCEAYGEPGFIEHLAGAIRWAAGP